MIEAAELWVETVQGKRSTHSVRIVEGNADGSITILDISLDNGLWQLGAVGLGIRRSDTNQETCVNKTITD